MLSCQLPKQVCDHFIIIIGNNKVLHNDILLMINTSVATRTFVVRAAVTIPEPLFYYLSEQVFIERYHRRKKAVQSKLDLFSFVFTCSYISEVRTFVEI